MRHWTLRSWRTRRLLQSVDELRRRAEASEQRFRMVFESAGLGMSIGSGGMLTKTNEALQRMLGYTGEELARLHYSQISHPDDVDLDRQATVEVMSGALGRHSFEKRYIRRDGSTVWAEVTLTRARDGSFGISLIEDITERKELEDELRQAHKMDAVGKLAGGIAHDFNNILTAITGYSDILLGEIDPDDAKRDRVEVIASSAARAAELTRQLLAFSRRQVLRLEPTDLAEVVYGFESLLRRLTPGDVTIEFDVERGAVARVDKAQLEQVLLSLVLNARDAMPRGGKLTVSVHRCGGEAELAVADDGTGMEEDTRSRVFEPFFTTKAAGAGTGLGLSTVDGIVGQSGGTISVESEPGAGSVFTIRLPLVREVATDVDDDARPETGAKASGLVLLAEDEEIVRRVTVEMLRSAGYEVCAAASGEEALALLRDGAANAAVLVTDVVMTGMDGRTLARRAREFAPSLPVLFISGYTADVLTSRDIVEEDVDLLTKPFTPAQLTERIEAARRLPVRRTSS